jgi:hypothetical protein
MVEPGAHAAIRRRAGSDGDGTGKLDVVDAIVLRLFQDGAHATNGEFLDVVSSDGRPEHADVRTKLPRALQHIYEWRGRHSLSCCLFCCRACGCR